MSPRRPLHWFEGFGIELEYMVCSAETLDVAPLVEPLLRDANDGVPTEDVDRGRMAWSNELVAHVVELKTNGPAKRLDGLDHAFHGEVLEINTRLAQLGARLLPSAMHPWMNPAREARLWPGDAGPIYAAFDRIFNCKGHGWSNLQSMHINLPFHGDEEFGRLHAAVRLVLPLLPALAASSPFQDGKPTGTLDNRLAVYRTNCAKVPLVTGQVVPEAVWTEADYSRQILGPMYRQIAPWDPEGILRHEWLNARGAIARFDRGTIEIRVLDVQECPLADLTIAATVVALVESLTRETWSSWQEQGRCTTGLLARQYHRAVEQGMDAKVSNRNWLAQFGIEDPQIRTLGQVWWALAERLLASHSLPRRYQAVLRTLIEQGSLATRLLRAAGNQPRRPKLRTLYARLADCLTTNQLFL